MQWLNKIVDEAIARKSQGEIVVSSGISPSGSYHMGYLREIIICDAIVAELRRRGRSSCHLHFVDDQDGFRKVPINLPPAYEKYLGQPLCDMPSPDGSGDSYADYCLRGFLESVKTLGIEIDIVRSHKKYREGFFVLAIELVLANIDETRKILEEVSGRKLDSQWSPIQVNEEGYLKKRTFVSINKDAKTIQYLNKDGAPQTTNYEKG
jgi:lysyl-tRNA synthetase class 1